MNKRTSLFEDKSKDKNTVTTQCDKINHFTDFNEPDQTKMCIETVTEEVKSHTR